MKFIALLNKEKGSGLAINALAQMVLGMGHRLEGYPDVNIFFGTTSQVREFRTLAVETAAHDSESTVYSDFPHTMKGGDTASLLDTVVSTSEENVTYYGSCIVAEEIDPRLLHLTESCEQLKGYTPYISEMEARLLPAIQDSENHEPADLKTTTLINKLPLEQTLNAVVLANIDMGRTAPYDMLHLLTIGRLTHISYNTHPVLKPGDLSKHKSMAEAAQKLAATNTEELYTSTQFSPEKNLPLVTVTFGPRSIVESIIQKKFTRVFADSLDLTPTTVQEVSLTNPKLKSHFSSSITTFGASKKHKEIDDENTDKVILKSSGNFLAQ